MFVVFVGFSDGIAQGAIFGDVALLPPKYTQVCLTLYIAPTCLAPAFPPMQQQHGSVLESSRAQASMSFSGVRFLSGSPRPVQLNTSFH